MQHCTLRRAAILATALLLPVGVLGQGQSAEQKPDPSSTTVQIAASEATSRFVPLGIGKSVVVDLPRDVRDILVADPKVANAVVRSSRRAYIVGVTVGQTSVFFFDAEGKQIAGLDIAVTRDLNGVRAALRQMFPNADMKIDGVGDGVVLTGSAANPAEAQQAYDLATRLVGNADKVVNAITVRGRDQVMLRVTVAEVQRDVVKQLGVDLNGQLGSGVAVLNFNTVNPFSAVGQALSGSNATFSYQSASATLRAMERAGVIRTLAEPNLTAISGESATFLAGGEFPIPAGLSCDTTRTPPICQQSIEYKKFGVGLTFTPIVLTEGRISLKVLTEASDISNENAITLSVPGTTQTITVPSIRVRRADTTVEIPSGGSLAMAGMIQEQTKQALNGVPGITQVPVLGALFRSRDYVNRQTELMVIVTPYIARAVSQKDLSRPDDGFADAADPSSMLLGRLNRIYGVPGTVDPRRVYRGNYGFILD
jgi:pilus assembly protein CpaC